jgi:hypothetical protein
MQFFDGLYAKCTGFVQAVLAMHRNAARGAFNSVHGPAVAGARSHGTETA